MTLTANQDANTHGLMGPAIRPAQGLIHLTDTLVAMLKRNAWCCLEPAVMSEWPKGKQHSSNHPWCVSRHPCMKTNRCCPHLIFNMQGLTCFASSFFPPKSSIQQPLSLLSYVCKIMLIMKYCVCGQTHVNKNKYHKG